MWKKKKLQQVDVEEEEIEKGDEKEEEKVEVGDKVKEQIEE
jgi:hypothetical protein